MLFAEKPVCENHPIRRFEPISETNNNHERNSFDTSSVDGISLDCHLRDELPSVPRLCSGKEQVPGLPQR
jgi:hypothetical protein